VRLNEAWQDARACDPLPDSAAHVLAPSAQAARPSLGTVADRPGGTLRRPRLDLVSGGPTLLFPFCNFPAAAKKIGWDAISGRGLKKNGWARNVSKRAVLKRVWAGDPGVWILDLRASWRD
jgi:hypothetical protein